MKNKILLFALAAIALCACEKKQVADPKNMEISFEYREVEDTIYHHTYTLDFRSTSTPSYIAPNLWYYWNDGLAISIGDGHRYFDHAGDYTVDVLYKPGVEPDFNAVHASRQFTITITGSADSIWHAAIPVEL